MNSYDDVFLGALAFESGHTFLIHSEKSGILIYLLIDVQQKVKIS